MISEMVTTVDFSIVSDLETIDPLHDDIKNQNKPTALCIVGFIGGPPSDNTVIFPPF